MINQQGIDKGYSELAMAICLQAIDDYTSSRRYLEGGRRTRELIHFRNQWEAWQKFYQDCGFEGKEIINMFKHEYGRFKSREARWNECQRYKRECERFIKSEDFDGYSGLDGRSVMRKIKHNCNMHRYGKAYGG